jgi:hypothetical protein
MQNGSCGILTSAKELNAGDFVLRRIFSALQSRKPPADRYAQRLECKPSVSPWKSLDLCKPGLKQILGALAVRSRIVVEGRCDLDQSLQEHLFRIESYEPDFLPKFMSVVEVPGIECLKSFPKKPVFFVRIHEPSQRAGARTVERTAS